MKNQRTISVMLGALALTATACGGSAGSGGGPIEVGAMMSFTGVLAEPSEEALLGMKLAAKQVNNADGIDGRDVKIIREDDQTKPATALRKGQKLATQDKVSAIVGVMSSAVGAAISPQLASWGAVTMVVGAKTPALTGKGASDYLFRVARDDDQDINAMAEWLGSQKDLKKWALIGADYNWGRENVAAFKPLIKKNGGEVTSEQYTTLGTKDFGPQISKIAAGNPDAVWVGLNGQDAIAFEQQAANFGLSGKATLMGVLLLSDSFVKAAGPASVGTVGNVQYDVNADNPENKTFVAAYTKEYNKAPTNYSFDGYLGMKFTLDGLRKSGGEGGEALIKALEGLSMDSSIGQVELDAGDHQIRSDEFIGRVVDKAGEPSIEILSEIPANVVSAK